MREIYTSCSDTLSVSLAMFNYWDLIFIGLALVSAQQNFAEDCSLRLGTYHQGFKVHCAGGPDQSKNFIKELRQGVLLPLLVKTALSTDLCPITSQLHHYLNHRQSRQVLTTASKAILEKLTDEQLESLLHDLQFVPQDEEKNSTISLQTQQQSQEINA